MQDLVSFLLGAYGIFHEIQWSTQDRPELLVFCGLLIGAIPLRRYLHSEAQREQDEKKDRDLRLF